MQASLQKVHVGVLLVLAELCDARRRGVSTLLFVVRWLGGSVRRTALILSRPFASLRRRPAVSILALPHLLVCLAYSGRVGDEGCGCLRHGLVEDVHIFPQRVLLHRPDLFLGELVAGVVDLLVVADRLARDAPLDPRLPRLAQSDWVHASLSGFSTRVLPEQMRRVLQNAVKETSSELKTYFTRYAMTSLSLNPCDIWLNL